MVVHEALPIVNQDGGNNIRDSDIKDLKVVNDLSILSELNELLGLFQFDDLSKYFLKFCLEYGRKSQTSLLICRWSMLYMQHCSCKRFLLVLWDGFVVFAKRLWFNGRLKWFGLGFFIWVFFFQACIGEMH